MPTMLVLINLLACAVVCALAMVFYLRRGAPICARQHYSQLALILVAVGAFGGVVTTLKGRVVDWPEVALHLGFALLAARSWLEMRGSPRRRSRA